jgi:hypothetical protein
MYGKKMRQKSLETLERSNAKYGHFVVSGEKSIIGLLGRIKKGNDR